MGCLTFYVMNRAGRPLYYHEWMRPKALAGPGSQAEDFKLMFGLVWSMKAFAAAMDPKRCPSGALGLPPASS
jgi:hypothetical protein